MEENVRTKRKYTRRAQKPTTPQVITNNGEPICFLFNNSNIGVRVINGILMFNISQMGGEFKKYASYWLKTAESVKLRTEMAETGLSVPFESQIISSKGRNGSWAEWRIAQEYAKQLSSEMADQFRECISMLEKQGVELYPQIKQYSSKTPSKPSTSKSVQVKGVSDEEIRKLFERMAAIEIYVKENDFKINYYNETVEKREWFRSSRIADDLNISVAKFNQFLFMEGICLLDTKLKQWVAVMKYRALQIDVPYYWTNKYGKTYRFGYTKRWTREGRDFLINLWHEVNKLQNRLLPQ